MIPFPRLCLLSLVLAYAIIATRGFSQALAIPPLTERDVPRETQMGSGASPAGAPGNGRYTPPVPAKAGLPTLWIMGDSTVRSGTDGSGASGNWGWGAPITAYFDLEKINVVNRAFGGTSSRTFYRDFFWKDLRHLIRKGDFVLIQFGANDSNPTKGALDGLDDIKTEMDNGETVHSFGWYLKQYIRETRAAGATPILCSLTPRKSWTEEGKFQRDDKYAPWTEQVAKETDAPFVPLNEIIARKYESLGKEKVENLYVPAPKENLHPGWEGAVINAECVVAGLKVLPGDPLGKFFSKRGHAVARWKPALTQL